MLSRRRLFAASAAALASAGLARPALSLAPGASSAVAAEKATFSMGTLISLRVYGPDEDRAGAWLDAADREMNRLADILTVHADESPILEVMRRSGEAVEVPEEAAEAVAASLRVARESGGAFEPTIGKLVDVWKIGFGGNRVPSDREIREALRFVGWERVRVTESGGRHYVRVAKGQDLDLGGIAKGYIGSRMAMYLRELGAKKALLNLGGNVVLVGSNPEGNPWRIGLQHPAEERNGFFAVLESEDESVITSGAYERKMEVNGREYGHILSAKTGRPVATDLSSVSIADRDGAKADAWCTAFFAMGKDRALRILASRPDIEAVLMSRDCRTVWMTPGIEKRCEVTDSSVKTIAVLKR